MVLLIIIFIISALSGYLAYSDIETTSRDYKKRRIVVIVFSVLTVIVSIFQYLSSEEERIKSETEKKKADNKADQLLKTQSELIFTQRSNKKESDSLNNIIIGLNYKINGKTEKLLSVTEKYSNEQSKFIDYTVGSDLPLIKLRSAPPNLFSIDIQNPSKNPIYGSEAYIIDFEEILQRCNPVINKKVTMSTDCYDSLIKRWEIGTLSGKQWTTYNNRFVAGEELHRYQMQFRTINKAYITYFVVKIVGNYFYWTMRLYENKYGTGQKILIKEDKYGIGFTNKYWNDNFYIDKEFVLKDL